MLAILVKSAKRVITAFSARAPEARNPVTADWNKTELGVSFPEPLYLGTRVWARRRWNLMEETIYGVRENMKTCTTTISLGTRK